MASAKVLGLPQKRDADFANPEYRVAIRIKGLLRHHSNRYIPRRDAVLPQVSLHQEANTETHLPGAMLLEPTDLVETFCMRVAYDVERACVCVAGFSDAVLNQGPADALAPRLWFNKQGIKLQVTVVTRKDGSESLDRACDLRNEYSTLFDLLERQLDGILMRQECVTVPWVVE